MSDPARERAIKLERLRDLYGQPQTPVYAAVGIVALIAVQTTVWAWPIGNRQGALLWAAIVIAMQLVLAALIRAFHRVPRADAELSLWGWLRTLSEVANGVTWALTVPMIYRPDEPLSLALVLLTLVGVVSGATSGLAVHMPALAAFLLGSMGSAAVLFAVGGTRGGVYAATMLATSGAWILANGVRMSLLYRVAIELRLDLADQVEARRRLQEEAETGRRLAEEAGVERMRFFGAASHDLRQPVHALGLYASLLRRDPPARQRRDLIAAITSCVDGLDQLFNAILGVAQAAQVRDEGRIEAFPLQEVVDRVLLQLLPEAGRRKLHLRARPTQAWVRADRTAVERILTNLTVNAVRYTKRGGVLVATRKRGSTFELVVADTGIGLSEADAKRIFEPFVRLGDRGEPRGKRGYGLGLATVRQLCLSHGHEISLRSVPGRGSAFRVVLPAAAAGSHEPATAARESGTPAPLNVLCLEDDPLVADAVGRLLKSWDLTGYLCATSAEALDILERGLGAGRWFGLLDYRLQGEETGLDVADAIRARFGRALPLALLTGELDPMVFEAAQRRDILVLQKPLRPIRLRALLAAAASAEPTA